MRIHDIGVPNRFEEVERSELRQLDSAFVDEMTDAFTESFYEDAVADGLRAATWDDFLPR